nr:T9SS type A sorting domain-containing protein [Chitinophagaceae bacterium]
TSFNTTQKVTLVTPCELKVPGVEVSPIAQFSGKVQEEGDELSWVISADNENSVYNLYQSNDGVNYQFISKIDSKATSMSAEKNSYSYMNTLASQNRNYYKLEQVSKNNGAIMNSKIVILERRGLDASFQVYPNPTSDVINVSINAQKANLYKIIISDMNGRQLKQIEAHGDAGMNTINIDIADYAAGLYSLQLFENNKKVYDQQVNKIK